MACVKRAVDEGVPILNPKWQQNATLKELESVFRSDPGDSSIPLLNERHVGLNELGMSRERVMKFIHFHRRYGHMS